MKKPVLMMLVILMFSLEATSSFGVENWMPLDMGSIVNFALFDIHFADKNNGWIVGAEYGDDRSVLHTSDGGKTWQMQSNKSQRSHYLFANRGVHFVDLNNGWIVGDEGVILHTSNGGLWWQKQKSGFEQVKIAGVMYPIDLYKVYFVDTNTGWAVGDLGLIIHTGDGGLTWERQSSKTVEILSGVSCIDNDNCWAVGNRGTILHTSTGGKQILGLFAGWNKQESGTGAHLYGVHFIDKENGWVVGAGGISHTMDGGRNWQPQARFGKTVLRKVFFVNKKNGWAVGTDIGKMTGAILHTEDGGKTWASQTSGTSNELTSVYFMDEHSGFAVGGNGTILRYVSENATGK